VDAKAGRLRNINSKRTSKAYKNSSISSLVKRENVFKVMMLTMGVQKGVAIWKRIATLSHSMRSALFYYGYKNNKY
ncbi:hypothetical protein, partial [Klebsiella pneumoniae]|uniref:hypothetical protein n=1 Tax=Klebsiella pneumoniae TaxID=573 RepID=UPI001D0DCEB2